MENFIKMDGNDDLVNPETDEIIPGEYIRGIFGYTGMYRQHMSEARAWTGTSAKTEVDAESQAMILKSFVEMTLDEQQRCRKDYPYLFYEGESQIDVYWRKWRNAIKNPYDEFAWQMLNDAGKLIGLVPIDPKLIAKMRSELGVGQRMRSKYLYRIEKMAGKGVAISGIRLYAWVHDTDKAYRSECLNELSKLLADVRRP